MRRDPDETMQFRIKRTTLYLALIPIAFVAGLAGGYLWAGSVQTPTAAPAAGAQVTAPVDQGAAVGTQGADSNTQGISSQLAELPRYEVPVSEDDAALGPADAPITIIEFADFQCPYCQRHAQETYPRLLEQYGDQIRFVYKDFPLSSIHPAAYSAAIAGTCALEQDKFWEYHDLLFSGRLELGRDNYLAYAAELGLDIDAFTTCFDEETYAQSVQEDYNFGTDLGVSSTPTFFVNGIAVVGAQPFSLFAEIIDYELAHPSN